jgi:cbb3-type cytochrome oxidase maturation protein
MSVLYVLLPLSLVLAAAAVVAFVWAVRSGQMDDLDTPSLRVLVEEDEAPVEGAVREPEDE